MRGGILKAPHTRTTGGCDYLTQIENSQEKLEGRVTKALSGFFTVDTIEGAIIAQLPGRMKKEHLDTDIATVGDFCTRGWRCGTARQYPAPRKSAGRSPRGEEPVTPGSSYKPASVRAGCP